MLTDWQLEWLVWFYRLRLDAEPPGRGKGPASAFEYGRGGQVVAPQKLGKGPLSAAVTSVEAAGPVVFDGWDARGEPVGRPWATPWIQVTAGSEDQTDNIWRSLVPMIELGDIAADIPDTGETRINLPAGGRIEPVTSRAGSRLGQRITFAPQDEAHDWTARNGGRKLADTQRRNLAGMGGRWMETGNAWDPTEDSVAQQTWESTAPGVFKWMRDAGPGSIRNKRERRKALRKVYEGSWWIDLDRIDAEIEELLERDSAQAERFFLNRVVPGEALAYDLARWREAADASIRPDGLITVGVDGALFDDALAIIATEVRSGHQWPLGIWEVPPNADDDYEHPLDDVDGALVGAFEEFRVWRVYIDPHYIDALVDRWQGRWGQKRIIRWFTNRPRPMAHAVRKHVAAVASGDLTHDGDVTFSKHIGNAVRQKVNVRDEQRRQMWVLAKDAPMSPRKIDAAPAAVLSWEARGDAIAAGALRRGGRRKASVRRHS